MFQPLEDRIASYAQQPFERVQDRSIYTHTRRSALNLLHARLPRCLSLTAQDGEVALWSCSPSQACTLALLWLCYAFLQSPATP